MTDRHNTERLGVNAVEQAFLKMDWVFREQPISDFGIDAHAEPNGEGGPTGQLIALQIKSGASYFKKRGNGFVFYGDARHLTYRKNHVLPVYPCKPRGWWKKTLTGRRRSSMLPAPPFSTTEPGSFGAYTEPSRVRQPRSATHIGKALQLSVKHPYKH